MTEEIQVEKTEDDWTNVKVDSQVFKAFMACQRYFQLHYQRHLVPITGPSTSILKGSLAHYAFQKFNEERIKGTNWDAARTSGLQEARKKALELGMDADNALLVYRTLEEFWEYKKTTEGSEIPLACERTFCILVYENEELKLRIFITGRIDLLFKLLNNPAKLYALDYKTEAESWFYSALTIQFKFYALATRNNVVIIQRCGFQKSKKAEEKFKTESINFDEDILAEFRDEIIPETCMNMLVAIENGKFAPNFANCIHGHFACMFSDKYNNGGICAVSPKVREEKLERFFTVGTEWSPEN
jgi:hypothetical protein